MHFASAIRESIFPQNDNPTDITKLLKADSYCVLLI